MLPGEPFTEKEPFENPYPLELNLRQLVSECANLYCVAIFNCGREVYKPNGKAAPEEQNYKEADFKKQKSSHLLLISEAATDRKPILKLVDHLKARETPAGTVTVPDDYKGVVDMARTVKDFTTQKRLFATKNFIKLPDPVYSKLEKEMKLEDAQGAQTTKILADPLAYNFSLIGYNGRFIFERT